MGPEQERQRQVELLTGLANVISSLHATTAACEAFATVITGGPLPPSFLNPALFLPNGLTAPNNDPNATGAKGRKRKLADGEVDEDGATGPGGRRKREKKFKDPDAPKRPPSAYLMFQNEVRQEYKTKHPELTYQEVLNNLAKMWHDMTDQAREPYLKAQALAKQQYTTAKATYDEKKPGAPVAKVAEVEAVVKPVSSPSSSDEGELEDSEDEADAADAAVPSAPVPSTTTTKASTAAVAAAADSETSEEEDDEEEDNGDERGGGDGEDDDDEEEASPSPAPAPVSGKKGRGAAAAASKSKKEDKKEKEKKEKEKEKAAKEKAKEEKKSKKRDSKAK